MITNYVWTGEVERDMGRDVSVPPYPNQELIDAMYIVESSEWLAAECENANQHSLQDFIKELIPYAETELELERFEHG